MQNMCEASDLLTALCCVAPLHDTSCSVGSASTKVEAVTQLRNNSGVILSF